MADAALAALIVLYAFNSQWGFRFQRVGRGILLRAHDTAAGKSQVFAKIMPGSYVASVWLGRVLWLSGLLLGWRAWGWYILPMLLAYSFFIGAWVDGVSPWPSYSRLLAAITRRIDEGRAGVEGLVLLPTIKQIEADMAGGAHFEAASTDVWLKRGHPDSTTP